LKNFGREDVKSRREEIEDETRLHKSESKESMSIGYDLSLGRLRFPWGPPSPPNRKQCSMI